MAFESKHSELLRKFAKYFSIPRTSDEDARFWTRKLAEQFLFTFPTEGWGTKQASPTRPPSTDVIARRLNGRLVGYDTVNSAGAPNATLNDHPDEMDINEQVFIPVEPKNHFDFNSVGQHTTLLGCSLFCCHGMIKTGETERLKRNLDYFKINFGGDYIRWFFTVGGDLFGGGQESIFGGYSSYLEPSSLFSMRESLAESSGIDPWLIIGSFFNDPQHEEICYKVVELLKSFDLKSHLVLVGSNAQADTLEKEWNICERAARLIKSDVDHFILEEMRNEYLVNRSNAASCHRMARNSRSLLGPDFPICLSSLDCVMRGGSTSEDVKREYEELYVGSHANRSTIHNTRPEPDWNPRSLRAVLPDVLPIFDGEGRGPGASAGGDFLDPNIMGYDYVLAIEGRARGKVFHSKPGVWLGRCNGFPAENKWENLYDIPGIGSIAEIMKGIKAGGGITPSPGPVRDKLLPGESLLPGQKLISVDRMFEVVYQFDGNLVIQKKDGTPVWSSHTENTEPGKCLLKQDGNFVIIDKNGNELKSSKTDGHMSQMIKIQEDGNLVIYSLEGIWGSLSDEME